MDSRDHSATSSSAHFEVGSLQVEQIIKWNINDSPVKQIQYIANLPPEIEASKLIEMIKQKMRYHNENDPQITLYVNNKQFNSGMIPTRGSNIEFTVDFNNYPVFLKLKGGNHREMKIFESSKTLSSQLQKGPLERIAFFKENQEIVYDDNTKVNQCFSIFDSIEYTVCYPITTILEFSFKFDNRKETRFTFSEECKNVYEFENKTFADLVPSSFILPKVKLELNQDNIIWKGRKVKAGQDVFNFIKQTVLNFIKQNARNISDTTNIRIFYHYTLKYISPLFKFYNLDAQLERDLSSNLTNISVDSKFIDIKSRLSKDQNQNVFIYNTISHKNIQMDMKIIDQLPFQFKNYELTRYSKNFDFLVSYQELVFINIEYEGKIHQLYFPKVGTVNMVLDYFKNKLNLPINYIYNGFDLLKPKQKLDSLDTYILSASDELISPQDEPQDDETNYHQMPIDQLDDRALPNFV